MFMCVIGWVVLGIVAGLAQAKLLMDATNPPRLALCPQSTGR